MSGYEVPVTTTSLPESVREMMDALPDTNDADGCVFLLGVAGRQDDDVCPECVQIFADRLRRVLDSGLFDGKLCPPVTIPLVNDRELLAAYLHTTWTMDELNEIFGKWFFPEGSVGLPLSCARSCFEAKPMNALTVQDVYDRMGWVPAKEWASNAIMDNLRARWDMLPPEKRIAESTRGAGNTTYLVAHAVVALSQGKTVTVVGSDPLYLRDRIFEVTSRLGVTTGKLTTVSAAHSLHGLANEEVFDDREWSGR